MCGISGVISFGSKPGRDLGDLERMHALIAHRGPDGEGTIVVDRSLRERLQATVPRDAPDPAAAFAFRRLRIQDLDPRADQPFARRDRRQWLLFNGEIYNHAALRNELGGEFVTHSDTEVALAAYARWGNDCFARFTGMWAIVIIDLDRGVIVGSRDRIGIKPLCYAFDGERLLLSSEAKAIAAVQQGGAHISATRFRQFLSGLPQASPGATFFEGIEQVPAGTWFEIPIGARIRTLSFHTFWDLRPFTASDAVLRDGDPTGTFGALLRDSVRSHVVADVPVGALLSGGLDSSAIARLMALDRSRRGDAPPKTFSITYADPAMDESRWIDSVIAQGGLDPTCEQLDASRVFGLTGSVVAAQGEPLLGWELIAQYRAFQLAREHGVIVVLDGQGADELLGGYPFYETVLVRDHLARLRLFEAFAEIAALAGKYRRPQVRMWWSYLFAASRAKQLAAMTTRYAWLPSYGDPLFRGEEGDQGANPDALNRLLYVQTRRTNLPAVLQYEDRNAMAHSVEARVPYLDHRLVELAFRLPQEWKIHRGDRKRILRHTAREILPADVIARQDKKAFVSNMRWFDVRAHADALHELLGDARTLRDAGLPIEPLRDFVSGFLSRSHDDGPAVWRIYTAWLWLKQFRPSPPESTL